MATLHAHHAFYYISLPSLHDYDVKWPNFKFFVRGRERQGDKFYHLCLNSGVAPSLQLQRKFLLLSNWVTLDNREMVWKDADVYFSGTFLWTSPLSDRSLICKQKTGVAKTGNRQRGTSMGNGKMKNRKTKPTLNPSPISNFISNSLYCSHFSFSRSPRSFPALPIPRFGNIPRKTLCSYEQGNLAHLFWPPKYCIPHIVAKIITIILNPSTISQSSMPDKSIIVTRLKTLQMLALVAFSQVSVKEKEKNRKWNL